MIPEIDVRGCIARKNTEGTLAFSYEADESLLDIPFVKIAGPVQVRLKLSHFGGLFRRSDRYARLYVGRGPVRAVSKKRRRISSMRRKAYFVRGEDDGEAYGYTNGRVRLEEFFARFVDVRASRASLVQVV